MKNKILCIFILLMFATKTFATLSHNNSTEIGAIVQNLPQLDSISCKFKQEKQLKNISTPIVSSGDFKFVKNEGVYFYTTYPIKSEVSYTNKNYKQIYDIMQAISTKKYSKLEQDFTFYFNKNNASWQLDLLPKKASKTNEILKSISIEGSKNIDKIAIELKNGNVTKIWFMTK